MPQEPTSSNRLGLVTVNYYSQDEISGLFASLAGSDIELVVVSNSPEADQLTGRFPCRFVRAPANIGFANACNLGASMLETEYLVFCNPDVRLTPALLEEICQRLAHNPEYGLLSPHFRPRPPTTEPIQQHDGRIIGFCMVMPRVVFEKIGGWDGKFFLWGEDGDLCDRIRQVGFKTGYANGLVAEHSSQHSIKSLAEPERRFLTRVWICSQIYGRSKRDGVLRALAYCCAQTGVNFIRWITGRAAVGRDYQDAGEAFRFGLRILANFYRLRSFIEFDGHQYVWGDPNRELAPKTDPVLETTGSRVAP